MFKTKIPNLVIQNNYFKPQLPPDKPSWRKQNVIGFNLIQTTVRFLINLNCKYVVNIGRNNNQVF